MTGPYVTAIPVSWKDKDTGELCKGFRHFTHETIELAANNAMSLAWDREAPQEVYFALGSIIELRKKKLRTIDNIKELKCYWADLDIGAAKNKYATRAEAIEGLKAFCAKSQLPTPYIVSSGGGFHVYWPLEEAVDCHTWRVTASALKALMLQLGLRADPSRTADCASVLRPVGTANWKTGEPRVVKCIKQGQTTTQADFAKRVAFANNAAGTKDLPLMGTPPTLAGQAPAAANASINLEVVQSTQHVAPPSDPRKVVKRCQQLSAQLTAPDKVAEPSWYDMVGCIRHCMNGAAAAHKMSARYPGYSAAATDRKIAHHEEGGIGPTLCTTFEDHNPGGCDGCPHKGKIKSPIVLGHTLERVESPTASVVTSAGATEFNMPDPPYPFVRVKNPATGCIQIAVEIPSEDGAIDTQVIYDNDLYPSCLSYDERENKFKARMCRQLPKDGWGEFEFSLGDLYDKRTLARILGNIGVLPDSSNMELLVQYMIGYIRQLQNAAAAAVVYAQLGWRDAHQQFILPDRVVAAGGETPVTPSSNIDNALSWSKHPPTGNLETWKQCVAAYEREGMEGHQFAFGVGFAAPLFQFTPFAGMVISVVGASGSGKSTAANCANSIWGHTHLGWADLENDTIRAFYNKLGVLRHLPVTYDEVTNLDPETVSNMCYAVSKGQGRQRLEQDGSAKANYGDWCTMMLTTSNSSLHAKLSGAKADASAEAVRVFEYYIPTGTMSKVEADTMFLPVREHYGLAGPVYAAALIENVVWVKSRVAHWGKMVDQQARVSSSERFWSAGAACVLAGFELANKVALTNVNLERILAFTVKAIDRMRITVAENVCSPNSVLADYLNGNLRNTLTVSSMPNDGAVAMVTHMPTAELRVRYDVWASRLYIDRAHFRRYCTHKSIDPTQVRRVLLDSGVLLGDNARVVLGKGTAMKTGQTHVWTIDMSHPAMGEAAVSLATDNTATAADASKAK